MIRPPIYTIFGRINRDHIHLYPTCAILTGNTNSGNVGVHEEHNYFHMDMCRKPAVGQ